MVAWSSSPMGGGWSVQSPIMHSCHQQPSIKSNGANVMWVVVESRGKCNDCLTSSHLTQTKTRSLWPSPTTSPTDPILTPSCTSFGASRAARVARITDQTLLRLYKGRDACSDASRNLSQWSLEAYPVLARQCTGRVDSSERDEVEFQRRQNLLPQLALPGVPRHHFITDGKRHSTKHVSRDAQGQGTTAVSSCGTGKCVCEAEAWRH